MMAISQAHEAMVCHWSVAVSLIVSLDKDCKRKLSQVMLRRVPGHAHRRSRYKVDLCIINSVTRWLDYFSTSGHLHQWKLAQWHTKFAKVGQNNSQVGNKPSENYPRLWRFCQNGKISPNLVTLIITAVASISS